MPRKSETYWERRTREREDKWNRKCREQLERETARQYNAALRAIEKDIMALYGTFASDNGLTMQDVRKLLHGQEFRQWRMGMKEYIEEIHHAEETGQLAKSAGLMRELNTLAMRSRISRLDKLRSETLMELDSLGRKRETAMGRFLADAYRDNYYRNLFEIGKEAGLKGSFAKADSKAVEDLLRTPWSGKNYSERIWVDMRKLETTIRDNIVQGIHRGVSASKMTKAVMDRMNVSRSNAERLVRTELCYVQNQASLDSIRESGMGFYRVCAAFDKRTCTKCASKDGIEVPVDEASPGDTLPPFHARCRCSIIASFGAGKTSKGKRIARDSEGRNIRVPADMKYSDWKAVYVDGSKAVANVTKSRNPGMDVTGEYKDNARPGQGRITQQNGFRANSHMREITAVNTLYEAYGGDFVLLDEKFSPNTKTPDFIWNEMEWDLKTLSIATDNAIGKAIRKGLKQINTENGGLVLDFRTTDFSIEQCLEAAADRMRRSIKRNTDIVFMHNGEIITIMRYLKQ